MLSQVHGFKEAYKELIAYMDLEREEEEPDIDKNQEISQTKVKFDPWCPLRAPKAELKQLPVGLRYEYLGPNETYPVIVNAALTKEETALLVRELRKHRKALGYSLDDLTGISPELCTHRIILEDESSSSIEHQRRLNPNLKEVVKKEIMKLLKAGVIIQYQIVHGSALYMSCQRKEGSQSSRMNMMSSFQQDNHWTQNVCRLQEAELLYAQGPLPLAIHRSDA
ncbi:unnamed protein product [Microthlaspi erraticum]|uniref:Uncharacterized protein n=1 Tax=Microthlaspi erraticum TaxID=1685480 RepID=A0A6D2I4M8_9BRAS|nr:unnamed protein product [Microthlaspi erraticum]